MSSNTISINVKIWDSKEFDFGQNSKSKSNYFIKIDDRFLDHLSGLGMAPDARFLTISLLHQCCKVKSSVLHLNQKMLRYGLGVVRMRSLTTMLRTISRFQLIEIIENENTELELELRVNSKKNSKEYKTLSEIPDSRCSLPPKDDSKISKRPENPEAKLERRGILAHWYEAYRKRFEQDYGEPPNAKVNSQIKSIHQRLGLENSKKYIDLYFQNNKYAKGAHTLEIFQKAIPEIPAWASRASGMVKDSSAFKEAETQVINDNGFERAMQEIRDQEAMKEARVIPFAPTGEIENAAG